MATTTFDNCPKGFHTLTPYLAIKGAAKAMDFYKEAFEAVELYYLTGPDGSTIAHAEMSIGDSRLMLSDEMPQICKSPETLGGSPCTFMLYVKDVDAVFARAIKAGATQVRPVELQFYGDRSGTLTDPFGHKWTVSTHVEDVPHEEIKKRMAAMFASHSAEK